MVGAGDLGNAAEFFGPRDLREKRVGVHHVRLDLLELGGGETPAPDRQNRRFLGRDHAPALAAMILEGPAREALDLLGEVAR